MAVELELQTRVIDVRTPGEYYFQGPGPQGSELVPLTDLPGRAATWSPEDRILVVCDDGRRSRRAVAWLRGHGFRNAQVLETGAHRTR